jgi:hypothetical protein
MTVIYGLVAAAILMLVLMWKHEQRAKRRHEKEMLRMQYGFEPDMRNRRPTLRVPKPKDGFALDPQDEDALMPVMREVQQEVEAKPTQVTSADTGHMYPNVTPIERHLEN